MHINIDSNYEDDDIQTLLLKCIFVLRHSQKNRALHSGPVDKSKWAVFWEIISQYLMSIGHDQDEPFNSFLTNFLFTNEELKDLRNRCQISSTVDISASKWLPLHCATLYSAASDEHYKVLSLSAIQSIGNRNENYQIEETKETPLHLAMTANNPNINTIRHLLKYFPRMVCAKTSKGHIPLHYAAMMLKNNNVEVIELLIQAYPKGLETKCSYEEVPLFKACRNRSENNSQTILKLLHAAPHCASYVNKVGGIPLHEAFNYNRNYNDNHSAGLDDIVQALLTAYHGSAMARDIHGNTPLHRLCGNMDITEINFAVELMLETTPAAVSLLNVKQQSPLHKLLRGGNGDGKDLNILVPMLLDVYPEAVSVRDTHGCYPIHYAVMNDLDFPHIKRIINGHPAALLAPGIQSTMEYAMTPIQLSLEFFGDTPDDESYDRLSLIKYLYKRCPRSIHIRSSSNDTLLHYAVANCHDSKKDQIVEAVYHMDPSAAMSMNEEGETPLLIATRHILSEQLYPSHFPEYFRFLFRMCPGAVSVTDTDEETGETGENIYEYVLSYYEDRKGKDEICDILCRMLLQAAPVVNPQALRDLNYQARRTAMFMFFSAVSLDDDDNIFTKLKLFDIHLARRVIMFL